MALLTGNWKFDVLAVLIGFCTVFYWLLSRKYSYWQQRGFKTQPEYGYIFGHFKKMLIDKMTFADFLNHLYKSTREPFIGIYGILRPILLVREPELVQSILIKDFSHFTDRGIYVDAEVDPLSANLFSLPGHEWKSLRGKLSPTFTSGKLKAMFSTLVDCGGSLQNHLEKLCNKGDLLDVREISASHATNVIASVAFGIDVDTIKDPNNDFRVCGRKLFAPTLRNKLVGFIAFIQPNLVNILRLKLTDTYVEKFIMSVVKQNLEYREKNNVSRKDFFQLLIQLRNSGTVQLDDEWDTVIKGDEGQKSLTFNQMAAQTNIFFIAGFETSSTTITFCMYELAKNREIQQRVHQEIDDVLKRHGGKITYESISEMKYLEACIDETLRKYPVLPLLNRTCVKDYKIPGTDKIIEKGVEIFLPIYGLQNDATYYEQPEKFKPERFIDESVAKKPYYPFGDGPRNCIGMRLGKMQTKVGIVIMLQKFKYELEDRLKNSEMKFDPNSFLLAPLGGLHLKVSKR